MAFGDAIMATSLVRGLHAQGKVAAFGDGKTIFWTEYCEDVFRNNRNIARPGAERQSNLVWFPHYKKHLMYCRYDGAHRYIWNYDFKAEPGELFFAPLERALPPADRFIVMEPNVAWQRATNCNKDWGEGKYEQLAKALMDAGHLIVQCIHRNSRRKIAGAYPMLTSSFHQAIGIMSQARLIIAPEGSNHHAAAAIGIPAIILWGDWSPTKTMGYSNLKQIYFTGGTTEACGNTSPCPHCRSAFDNISVDEVYQAASEVMH